VDASAHPMHLTDAEQVEPANGTGKIPVVSIHGFWLLPSRWDRWAPIFEILAGGGCPPRGSRRGWGPCHSFPAVR
jgi:hypothetical protein